MGRKVHEIALLLALAACRPEAPPPPAAAAAPLAPATRRALAELAQPVAIRADLRDLPREQQARVRALLDGLGRWSPAPLDAPGVELAVGARTERLRLAAGLESAEVEAALATRILRLAHGRKRVGVIDGDALPGLLDPAVGLSGDYDVVGEDWSADVVLVDGPRAPIDAQALEGRLRAGLPTLVLVRPDGDRGLVAVLARHGFTVRPDLLVDPKNGTPIVLDGKTTTLYAPLAQVLAGGVGEPLAHMSYVACPRVVAIDGAPGARPLLRTAPTAYPLPGGPAGSRVVAWQSGRLIVVGSADLVGADRLALHAQLGAEVTGGGFRAVHELVDWLAADVDVR